MTDNIMMTVYVCLAEMNLLLHHQCWYCLWLPRFGSCSVVDFGSSNQNENGWMRERWKQEERMNEPM